ncbi:MAG: 50S ribosomal protein L24 [Planctomycetaceae bacterium]|nr:50S ribosomal protein L24 [Planctomycetaceae bacterium]
MHIKVDDTVKVITGDDRGETGRVLSVDRNTGSVVVEGVRKVYKHVRRSQKNPQGGRLSKEMPIPLSNVQLICSGCGKPTRTGARYQKDGTKERFCRSCSAGLGQLAPPKATYASS